MATIKNLGLALVAISLLSTQGVLLADTALNATVEDQLSEATDAGFQEMMADTDKDISGEREEESSSLIPEWAQCDDLCNFVKENHEIVYGLGIAATTYASVKLFEAGKYRAALKNLANAKISEKRQKLLSRLDNPGLSSNEKAEIKADLSVLDQKAVAIYFKDKNTVQTWIEVLKAAMPL